MRKTNKTAVLLATCKLNDWKTNLIEELDNSQVYDTYILFNDKGIGTTSVAPDNSKMFSFSDTVLSELGFTPICENILPGSNHFGLLSFFRKNDQYKHYWYIEDDVLFNGEWSKFFEHFNSEKNRSDFLSSYILDFADQPKWNWWGSLSYRGKLIPDHAKTRSFNPIYRISNKSLKMLDLKLSDGWSGHHEVLIPTILKWEGLALQDFGGTGRYVAEGEENMFYHRNDGNIMEDTMRYRPLIDQSEIQHDLLYHPVKFL